ncbi:GerAB/ArcD/ProY family transporter [Paenibacillus radicis (ex Xue et al. 2023)]|uniref:Spore germination protein n=1 Tax=Paenibacillus radicis (ex Xue et al. 2023) TaxID=2972489 RepID=A0ABT1YGE6_9BACL|nr:spore germination protein [Paenibacillus radicis (ex Xue et al. 2023)]MCR8632273.1 spore germination protein [Paenibacillus radicis (ex Xue et al. 2023)]
MRTHHIGVREVASIGIIFIITKIFLPLQRLLTDNGGTAAWIIILIAGLLCPLIWWGVRGVLRNGTQGSTLITATEEIWGPYLGSMVNLAYFSLFFIITFTVLREFSELLTSDILLRTPLKVILLSLLITAAIVAYSGIEAMGRLCWLTIGLIIASVFITLVGGLMTHSEPNALSPFWGTGRTHVLTMGIVKSSLFSELLVLGFLVPRMRKTEEWGKAAWWCMAISSIVLFSTTIVYLYVVPYPTATRLNVPMFEISRIIIFGRWIQRVESLFLIVWLLCAVIKLSIAIYCCASTLSQMLRLPRTQPLIIPLSIIIYSFALLPASEMAAVAWDRDILRTYGSLISVCLPMATWLAGTVRRKWRQP